MKKRTAYQCEYCKKVYLSKQAAGIHEGVCFFNPKRKACATCSRPYIQWNYEYNDSNRLCEKGHNITKKLKYCCRDYSQGKGFDERPHPDRIKKEKNCKHENKEYLSGNPDDTRKICLNCEKLF